MKLQELLGNNSPDGYCLECGKPFWFSYGVVEKTKSKKFCCKKCWQRTHYRKNPEKAKEYSKRWCKNNPEKHREALRLWRKRNLKKARKYGREYARKWRIQNPKKYKAILMRYKLKKAGRKKR